MCSFAKPFCFKMLNRFPYVIRPHVPQSDVACHLAAPCRAVPDVTILIIGVHYNFYYSVLMSDINSGKKCPNFHIISHYHLFHAVRFREIFNLNNKCCMFYIFAISYVFSCDCYALFISSVDL
jgi:hypothetical protein